MNLWHLYTLYNYIGTCLYIVYYYNNSLKSHLQKAYNRLRECRKNNIYHVSDTRINTPAYYVYIIYIIICPLLLYKRLLWHKISLFLYYSYFIHIFIILDFVYRVLTLTVLGTGRYRYVFFYFFSFSHIRYGTIWCQFLFWWI